MASYNYPKLKCFDSKCKIFLCFNFFAVFAILILFNLLKAESTSHIDDKVFDSELILHSGNECFENKDYHGAIFHYTSLIDQGNNLFIDIAWSNLATSYRFLENYDEAIKAHKYSIISKPDNINHIYNYGVTLQLKGELQQAISQYQHVLEADSDHLNAYYNTALAYHDLNELDISLKYYSQVLKRNAHHIDARLNTCNILFAMKNYLISEKCYHDVLTVNSTYVRGLINLASFYQISIANLSDVYQDPFQPSTSVENNNDNGKSMEDLYTYLQVIIDLYKQALAIEPHNKIALHGLRSLLQDDRFHSEFSNNSLDTMSNETVSSIYKELDENILSQLQDKTSEIDKSYIRELFDSYAYHFEQALVHELKYFSHTLVANAIEVYYNFTAKLMNSKNIENSETRENVLRVLDLGSGTGLACMPIKDALQKSLINFSKCNNDTDSNIQEIYGHNIHNLSSISVSITGVDLSDKMLHHARNKNCYEKLEVRDIYEFLISETSKQSSSFSAHLNWDIVVAADVFVYIGNLSSLLKSIYQVSSKYSSLVVFTVEALTFIENKTVGHSDVANYTVARSANTSVESMKDMVTDNFSIDATSSFSIGYKLQASGRFAHSYDYLIHTIENKNTGDNYSYDIITIDKVILRENNGDDVKGYLVVLKPKSSWERQKLY